MYNRTEESEDVLRSMNISMCVLVLNTPTVYSLSKAVFDLAYWWYQKDFPDADKSIHTRLLSGLVLIGTSSAYIYKTGSIVGSGGLFAAANLSNLCPVFIGLAISSGMEAIIAIQKARSEWSRDSIKNRRLILDLVIKTSVFCGWASLALGYAQLGAYCLIASMLLGMVPLLTIGFFCHRRAEPSSFGELLLAHAEADNRQLAAAAREEQPGDFKAFSGTSHRLGDR